VPQLEPCPELAHAASSDSTIHYVSWWSHGPRYWHRTLHVHTCTWCQRCQRMCPAMRPGGARIRYACRHVLSYELISTSDLGQSAILHTLGIVESPTDPVMGSPSSMHFAGLLYIVPLCPVPVSTHRSSQHGPFLFLIFLALPAGPDHFHPCTRQGQLPVLQPVRRCRPLCVGHRYGEVVVARELHAVCSELI
jgi:ferredoxin